MLSSACPLVTVCIPTYNGAAHLRQCLDSILAQTHRRLDVLAVHDCSVDDTFKILGDYQKRDNRPRVTKNPTNLRTCTPGEGRGEKSARVGRADGSALDVLDALSAQYPALTGPVPLMYVLAPEGWAIKRRLGRLLARQTRR